MKKMMVICGIVFAMFCCCLTGCGTTTSDFDSYAGGADADSTVMFVYDEDGNVI